MLRPVARRIGATASSHAVRPKVGFSIVGVPAGRARGCPGRCGRCAAGPSSTTTAGMSSSAARPAIHALRVTASAARCGVLLAQRVDRTKNPGCASTTTSTLSSRRTSGTAPSARGAERAPLGAHLGEDALEAGLGARCPRASSPRRPRGGPARSARASRARRRGSSGGPRGRSAARSCASPRARSCRARSGCGSRGRARRARRRAGRPRRAARTPPRERSSARA